MTQAASITVKKADGTTDIIYSAFVGSQGSTQPAVWRSPNGAAPAHKAELRIRSNGNKAGTVRRLEGTYVYPQTATAVDGSITVVNRGLISFSLVVPQAMPQTEINEMIHQGLNLLASSHVKTQGTEGYAAT
jgi:hypothetical protein